MSKDGHVLFFKLFGNLDLLLIITSFGDDPDTSIQVLEKRAQVPKMNVV